MNLSQQVQRMIQAVLGVEALSATHQLFGHNSIVFDVALANGESVIVRTNTDPAVFAGTQRNLSLLAGLGLPVARVIAADLSLSRWPFAYLVLPKIPGRDLRYALAAGMTLAQMTRVAEQVAGFQRTVNASLPAGTGFGYAPIGAPGPFTSWWDLVQRELPPQANLLLRAHESYLRGVAPTCFLDDVTVKNVLVENGQLRGLIDFDVVCYGDPLFWLALTAVGVVCDVGTRELFYVGELRRAYGATSPEQDGIFALYAACIALGFVDRFAATATAAWRARMDAAVAGWLHAAEQAPLPR